MAAAGLWAFIGASALVLGALIAMSGRLSSWALALLIGFAAGALISAVAYDLVEEAVAVSAAGLSVAIGFVAIFISNVPESVAASTGMLKDGRGRGWVIGIWTLVAVACAIAAALGYALAGASGDVIASIDAFAAGAILTLLASELLPAAHAEKTRFVGLATAAGFAVAAMPTLNG